MNDIWWLIGKYVSELSEFYNIDKFRRRISEAYAVVIKTNDKLGKYCQSGKYVSVMLSSDLDWDYGLYRACKGGHRDIAELMIARGSCNFNAGLNVACKRGHIDIADLMIAKGATDLNKGLYFGCQGGHTNIIDLMIAKGADDWNSGLYGACEGGHYDIAELVISKGANGWYIGTQLARMQNHENIVVLLTAKANEQNINFENADTVDYDAVVAWMREKFIV